MANILTQKDEQNKQTTTSAPLQQAGGVQSTSAPSTASNPAAKTANARPQGSGRFTNLQKYLGANQKASEQLSGGIRQKGESYMDEVRQGIQSAQDVQQGIQDERSRIGQAGTLAQGIRDDAVSVAQNNLQDVTQLRLGQNQANQLQGRGQQSIQNLSQNINPLEQFGQNLGTESGRFQVLQDTFGGAYKPNYNMGQRRLDQLFLQAGNDQGLSQLGSDIGQTVSSANQNLSSLQRDLGGGIQDIRYGSQQAQQDILNAIGQFNPDQVGAFSDLYSDFGTEQTLREQELQQNLDRARAQLGAGVLTQDVADLLNLTGNEQYGVMDLQDYANRNINLGDTDVTMADVLNRGDLESRLQALSLLSGTDVSDYTSRDDFGVAEGSDIGFNRDQFISEAQKNIQDADLLDKTLYDVGEITQFDPARDGSRESYSDRLRETTIRDLVNPSGSNYYENIGVVDSSAPLQQQLESIRDYNLQQYDPVHRNWYKDRSDQFQRLLDYISNRDRRLQLNDDVQNLEGGGFFNVT